MNISRWIHDNFSVSLDPKSYQIFCWTFELAKNNSLLVAHGLSWIKYISASKNKISWRSISFPPAPILLLSGPVGKVSPPHCWQSDLFNCRPSYHTLLNWHRISIRQHFRESMSQTFIEFIQFVFPCQKYDMAKVPSDKRHMLGSHSGGTKWLRLGFIWEMKDCNSRFAHFEMSGYGSWGALTAPWACTQVFFFQNLSFGFCGGYC